MFKKTVSFFRNAQQIGKFTRLVREVNEPFHPENALKFNFSEKKRDPLEELASLMATRPGICAVLDEFGVAHTDRSSEFIRLFHMLIQNGAGQWVAEDFVPTAVLYDLDLLRLALDAERLGTPRFGEKAAILALRHVETHHSKAA